VFAIKTEKIVNIVLVTVSSKQFSPDEFRINVGHFREALSFLQRCPMQRSHASYMMRSLGAIASAKKSWLRKSIDAMRVLMLTRARVLSVKGPELENVGPTTASHTYQLGLVHIIKNHPCG
jgi:hypothetical protein